MREIKFQYMWRDRDDKFHILTETIEEIEEHADIPSNRKMGWVLVARREYTGLHDKNGKEIYEGDKIMTNKGVIYTVWWSLPMARWAGRTLNVWTDEAETYFYKALSWLASRGGSHWQHLRES